MNVIFGSSGFAKEVDFLLRSSCNDYQTNYFIDVDTTKYSLNGIEIISEDRLLNILANDEDQINVYFGMGDFNIRRKIFDKFKSFKNVVFPNAIHQFVLMDISQRIKLGSGNIICGGTILTTDIEIGDNNHINLNSTVGHDCRIGNFNTISPGVHISGNVVISDNTYIGTGAVILEKLTVCSGVTIGAGAVVVKNIEEPGTYVGLPAKKLK